MGYRRFCAIFCYGLALLAGSSGAQSAEPYPFLFRPIVLAGHTVKWGTAVAGSPAIVTWAVLDRPHHTPDAINCRDMDGPEPLLESSRIPREIMERELAAAFAAWSAVAGIEFRYGTPATADILVGTQRMPRGRAFTNVAFDRGAARDRAGFEPLDRALICLNPQAAWKIGFDGNLAVYDLRYAFMHEIGHAIGLDHPQDRNTLMDFRYEERFREPQAGDRAGAVALYGPPMGADRRIAEIRKAPGEGPSTSRDSAIR